jgi:5-enolpyruvylshikimate-3-phosphate synthase
VAALAGQGQTGVDGWDGVATSYPEFLGDLARLGLDTEEVPA